VASPIAVDDSHPWRPHAHSPPLLVIASALAVIAPSFQQRDDAGALDPCQQTAVAHGRGRRHPARISVN
jgi:hypothetical protein